MSARTRTTFVVDAVWNADVLARVVTLFHRLNFEILALTMKRAVRREALSIRVTVKGEADRCDRIEAHLYKVVHVRSVTRQDLVRHVTSAFDLASGPQDPRQLE